MTPAGENTIRGVALTSTRGLFGRGPARTGVARARASRGTTATRNRITHPLGSSPSGLGPLLDGERCKERARFLGRCSEHRTRAPRVLRPTVKALVGLRFGGR